MLVNSRKASTEARHLGAYEVVFVAEMPEAQGVEPVEGSPISSRANNDRLGRQLTELKRDLESMRRTITRSAMAPSAGSDVSLDGADAYHALTASDVNPELAQEIIRAAEARSGNPQSKLRTLRTGPSIPFRAALMEELESRIKVQATIGRGESRPRIVALVGPPGCGKTATLVKLAVNYGLPARRPVLLLSTDTYRVAAAEQLRAYAAILGVGFQLVETVAALSQAIEENSRKELILIDTPGLGAADVADGTALAQFLSTRQDIDTQLVVSCSMKSADLSRVVDSFEAFQPQRMIFTRLDETCSFGPVLNEVARTGKAVSFFTTGQRIPEDLEAATKSRLAELILSGVAGLAESAA
jgi:flagellar biosynthesis protein FlhF